MFAPERPAPPAPRVSPAESSFQHMAACAWQIQPRRNGATQSLNGTGDSRGTFQPLFFFAQLTVNPEKSNKFQKQGQEFTAPVAAAVLS